MRKSRASLGLYKSNVLSLSQAVYCIKLALSQIEEQFENVYKAPKIFISHATADSIIVEKLVTMLEQIGVKQSQMFCSSITGYGIPQGAGDLYNYIRNEMSNDNLFVIMMLSSNYYSSPVCLNEMGATWVKMSAYQSILLPGFQYSEIKGAVNPRDMSFSLADRDNRNHSLNEFKDRIITHLGLENVDYNLWERFRDKFTAEVDQIATSAPVAASIATLVPPDMPGYSFSTSTDDEKIILYYILRKKVRKIKKQDVEAWLQNNEIYDVNVDNAFDLLSTSGNGITVENIFEMNTAFFRKVISSDQSVITDLESCLVEHQKLGSHAFLQLWESGQLDDTIKLFLAYIIDEHTMTLGDRWLAEHQERHIKEWEEKYSLESIVSNHYVSCLNLFIKHHFVHECEWTRDNNPRKYKLCASLEELFFLDCSPIQRN